MAPGITITRYIVLTEFLEERHTQHRVCLDDRCKFVVLRGAWHGNPCSGEVLGDEACAKTNRKKANIGRRMRNNILFVTLWGW